MPARLRVRRRSLNAPQAGAAACQAAFGAAGFSSPTSRLRLRGVRATRGARSEEITCAQHRRHAMVSRASFAFPRGHASRARAWRERGSQPSPPGAHINLASQRSQGRYSVVVRDLYRLDCTWLRNHFPKPYFRPARRAVRNVWCTCHGMSGHPVRGHLPGATSPRRVYSPRLLTLGAAEQTATPRVRNHGPYLGVKKAKPGGMYNHQEVPGSESWVRHTVREQLPEQMREWPTSPRTPHAASPPPLPSAVIISETSSVQAVRQAILPEQQPLRRGMRQCKVLHGVMDGVGGAITPGSFFFVTAEAEQQRASSPGGDGGCNLRPQTARPAVDMRRPLTAQDTVAGRALPRLWYEVVEYPPMLTAEQRKILQSSLCGTVRAAKAAGGVGIGGSATVRPGRRAVGGLSRPESAVTSARGYGSAQLPQAVGTLWGANEGRPHTTTTSSSGSPPLAAVKNSSRPASAIMPRPSSPKAQKPPSLRPALFGPSKALL